MMLQLNIPQQVASSSNNNGFTLIELMIGLAIFSIGLLSLFAAITLTMRNNTSGDVLTKASMLAQTMMEREKMRTSLLECDTYPFKFVNEFGQDMQSGANFNVEIDISDPLGDDCQSIDSGSRLIVVTVSVIAGVQQNRSVTISSIITGNGI